ncbi:MAG: molecular chaperone HtpG [Myxococcota bacterium]|jgi:molecular chaperone HtpG
MTARELGFKAEVQQLLDLMIHSLYSDREIFLRELVSNAADALDKAHFMSLTHGNLIDIAGDVPGIRITADEEANTITIEDDGVGMTVEEAEENLGTIAHSGSKAFIEKLKSGQASETPDLIGQFGVGFYASFMVADRVVVETRSVLPDAEPVRWISEGKGTFTIEPGERTTRGTHITLHMREDATEFGNPHSLNQIVRKHSNFLPWPILVDGEKANTGKALWAEQPSQVSDEEANEFYKTLSMDFEDPALTVHVSVDSPLQYHALLFIPSSRPYDLFNPEATVGPRLYARRVLIAENADDLLPKWLRFVRGVVDSEDIQLNVSREMVQKTPVVRKIRDALTKRILKQLGKVAKKDGIAGEGTPFGDIWNNFGVVLKEGYYHASSKEKELLLPLLRFNTLSHDDDEGLMSLAQYIANMPEGQDNIWYITAESRQAALASPHLEALKAKGYDVLLLTDPVDEWLTNLLTEFEGTELKSVARGQLDLDEDDDAVEKADLGAFTPWLKELMSNDVADVRTSTRLTDSACVLVDADDGISSNMERILKGVNQEVAASKRVLELNAKHPLIRDLVALHEAGKSDVAEPLARMLYDDAMLLEGAVKEPAAVGRRLQALLAQVASSALNASA